MKEVTAYKSDDGTLCATEREALYLDIQLRFKRWYFSREIDHNVEPETIYGWLEEHRVGLLTFLNEMPDNKLESDQT